MTKTVTIVQRVLPHYRLEFFSALRKQLQERNIALRLIYGQEVPGEVPMTVECSQPWAQRIQNRYFGLGSLRPVWQPCVQGLQGSDLVIVEQASSLLLNYWLIAKRHVGGPRLAYWGHGKNFQSGNARGFRAKLKRRLTTAVDWWFAYTDASAHVVISTGFPSERITVVNNSIDTDDFRRALDSVTPEEVVTLKRDLRLENDAIGLYCGGMYPDKKLDFLLDSCHKIKKQVPGFHIICIGSGPEQQKIAWAAENHDWIHYVGPKFGRERATYFKASDILMMPGLVGLAIVDSFVAETPLITTDVPLHSPEIAYLRSGENGLITPYRLDQYVATVTDVLQCGQFRQRLKNGCHSSSQRYTLTNFVSSFVEGVAECLR